MTLYASADKQQHPGRRGPDGKLGCDGGNVAGDKPLSCAEIFERDCPYYLAIGMTYEQYWYGDPLMVRAFYKADKFRREREDMNAWLQGVYFKKAIEASIG